MKRIHLITAMALIAVLVSIFSCGDSANEPAKTQGDPNDITYIQAKSMTEAYVDSVVQAINFAAGYMNFDGTSPLGTTADSANVNYDPQTCWWEIYLSSDTTGASLLFIDSVTFDDGTGCQMFPDSATTMTIEYRALANLDLSDQSGSVSVQAHENVVLSGIQSDQIAVSGSNGAEMNMNIIADTIETTLYYNYAGSATSVTFNKADLQGDVEAHPLSGSLNLGLAMALTGQNGNINVSWNMIVTFFEDHYHVYAESGANYWEWDHYYPPL